MRLSEDRIEAIAQKIIEHLRAEKIIRLKGLPSRAVMEIQRVVIEDLKVEDEINEEVEARIDAMKRDIPYGSAEWNAVYTQIKDELCQKRNYDGDLIDSAFDSLESRAVRARTDQDPLTMSLIPHAPMILLRSAVLAARTLWLLLAWPWTKGSVSARDKFLFLYSQVVWDEVWQRPQELALRIARERPVLFFCPVQIHRLYDSLRGWSRTQVIEREGGKLAVFTPLIFPGEYKSRLIRRLNALVVHLEARIIVGDGVGVTLLTNSPFSLPLVEAMDWRCVVYDVIDDFTGFDWSPPESVAMHERLLLRCDAVTTGTGTLLDDVSVLRPDAEYAPSGVRADRFLMPTEAAPAVPHDLKGLNGPLVGYTGSISDRLDRDLIAEAARRRPDVQFVFVGPVHGSFGPKPEAPNLHFLGLKPHEALPAYLWQFDLAIMPFRQTAATRAINPVKTLEYLAAGRVTLSMPIPDLERFYSDVVVIADSREDFLAKIDELLTSGNEERRLRGIERAKSTSWDAMATQLITVISHAEAAGAVRRLDRAEPQRAS